jgi:hypothetical protein
MTANTYEDLHYAGLRVLATKGHITAAFGINLLRTPYFFKDREVTIGPTGSKRRIFHIVRTHARTRGDTTSRVRSHFRGERKFRWNGYDIQINVPGTHHRLPIEFDVGAVDEFDKHALEHPEQYRDGAAVDDAWVEHVRGTAFHEAFAPLLSGPDRRVEHPRPPADARQPALAPP